MSMYQVVALVGAVVLAAGVVAIGVILRSGPIIAPLVVQPHCATCGHPQPEHGGGHCGHKYGDERWGNDSFGTDWPKWGRPDYCDCRNFTARRKGAVERGKEGP
ncbi:hypothetical protein JK364_53625 [Streptomyces sp. 110]|uniref:Uncharacterized protein n=1 Tax=Streptomyces endocoffeicus TaxID=2898945 RepID=A0ABS1Q9I0_9ACTN|nr:hypothetical protein [Streptomyces endocoffeicus]MBL1121014.1 hypothetical protein [Streptomyces endocoffeicus]